MGGYVCMVGTGAIMFMVRWYWIAGFAAMIGAVVGAVIGGGIWGGMFEYPVIGDGLVCCCISGYAGARGV